MQPNPLKQPAHKNGPWLVLAAAVLWGTTGTAQAFAPGGVEPAVIGAMRLVIGGLTLLALAAVRGSWPQRKPWPVLATLMAAGSMAAYQLCFFAAVTRTGVVVGTIVAIGSAPILAGLLAWLVRAERPSFRWLAATVLAVLGCSLLVASGGSINVNTWGVILALGAACAYATFTTASKGLLAQQPAQMVMAVIFCLGALFLLPVLFKAEMGWLLDPRGLGVALHLGLIATAAAYSLFGQGLVTVPVATAVTLSLAEPLTAGLLGVLVLGERLAWGAWLGLALLFSGLAVLSLGPQPINPAAGQCTGREDG